MTGPELVALLETFRFNAVREAELQECVSLALRRERVRFDREVGLTGADRIDFLLDDGVGLELKVDGSVSAIARQVQRYCEAEVIRELVVGTTRMAHAVALRNVGSFHGKPVRVVRLKGGGAL